MRYQAALRSDRGGSVDEPIIVVRPALRNRWALAKSCPCRSRLDELVERGADFQEFPPHFFKCGLQSLSRGGGRARRGGGRFKPEQGRRRLGLNRPCGFFSPPTLSEELLHSADRVPFLVEKLPDPPQQIDILRPIVTAASPAFERLDFWKFGLPEAQHMCRKIEFLRDLTGATKGSARFAGTPKGRRLVRPGHLSPMAPWPMALWPPAQRQPAPRRRSLRRNPD